jgi:uncharacterized protein (TIGR02246 family)
MATEAAARAAIEALLAAMEAAWNHHDGAAFAELFAEDADFTNVFGMHTQGRAAITAAHVAILTGPFRDSTVTVTETRVRFIRPDVAAVDARWRMDGARDVAGNPWPDRRGIMSLVAAAADGVWRFAVFHNLELPPEEKIAEMARLQRR